MSDKTIHQLLGEIMAEVPAIPKGQRNQQQGYAFRGIDDVFNTLHSLFADRGVYIMPKVLESEYLQQPLGQSGNLATDARLLIEFVFTAPDGSKDSMIVMGESRDWADKATNQAMSAGYKTGLLEMFLIPLEETKDADSESPVGVPMDQLSEDEIGKLKDENEVKAKIVDILGREEAIEFWDTHQGLTTNEMWKEAENVGAANARERTTGVDDRLEKLAGRVLGNVPDKKGPLAQGIKEMFDYGWKLELIAPEWLENNLDPVKTITDLSVEERQVVYKALQKELATPLRDAQKAAAGR